MGPSYFCYCCSTSTQEPPVVIWCQWQTNASHIGFLFIYEKSRMISFHPTMLVWTPVARDACEGLLEAASNHFVPPRTILLLTSLVWSCPKVHQSKSAPPWCTTWKSYLEQTQAIAKIVIHWTSIIYWTTENKCCFTVTWVFILPLPRHNLLLECTTTFGNLY
jgi:hypothetical protein